MLPLSRSQLQRYRVDDRRRPTGAPRLNRASRQARGLVGWWPFNTPSPSRNLGPEAKGGSYLNSATLEGSAALNLTSEGYGVETDNSSGNNRVNLGHQIQEINGGALEGYISWWQIPHDAHNSGTQFFMWGQNDVVSAQPEFTAQHFTDNNLYIGWAQSGNDDRVVVAASTSNWLINEQNHYVLTWADGGTSYLYHNGRQIGSQPNCTVITSWNDVNLYVNCAFQAAARDFDGFIWDFRIGNWQPPESFIRNEIWQKPNDLIARPRLMVPGFVAAAAAQEPLYVEIAAPGEERFPAAAAFAAEASSLDAQGVEQPEATADLTLGIAELDATGELPVDGAGNFAANPLDLDASGVLVPAAAADLVLQDTDLTAVGAAGEPEGAASLALQLFELDAAGVLVPAGAGVLDLAAADLAAQGVQIVVGASDLILQLLELDAAGEHIAGAQPEGTANLVLTPIDLDAVGLEHPRGTGVFDLAAALLSATGEESFPGVAVFDLGIVDLAALGRQIQTGAADLQLELAELVATGAIQPAGTADLTLQLLQLAATGHQVPVAVADLQLQVNELAAIAELPFEAAAQLLIASLRLTAAGEITAPFTPGLVAAVCSQAGIATSIGGAGVTSDIGPDE